MSKMLKRILEWRNILIAVVASTVAVIFVDFALVFFFGPQFRFYASYIFGSNDKETIVALLFAEGAIIFGMGALFASGYGENRMQQSANPASPHVQTAIWKQRPEQREKQNALGCMLMLIAGPLLLASFILVFA